MHTKHITPPKTDYLQKHGQKKRELNYKIHLIYHPNMSNSSFVKATLISMLSVNTYTGQKPSQVLVYINKFITPS